jgi:hypothetical protein
MSSIAIMPVMIFLKASYSLKSHPYRHGNRALLVSPFSSYPAFIGQVKVKPSRSCEREPRKIRPAM